MGTFIGSHRILTGNIRVAIMNGNLQSIDLDFDSRRIFCDDELEYFERALIMYADMGWPIYGLLEHSTHDA